MEGGHIIMPVTFPDLSSLNNESGIDALMALPNASYPYFWAWIMAAIWIIISSTLYFTERDRLGKGNLLSSMAVSCLAVILLATIGTVLTIISVDIMTYILVISAIIIGIWFFTKEK